MLKKVSIITVCFNSEKYINDSILSVLSQTYKNIEYIVIDGGSNDSTIDIVNSYGFQISKFISEPDKGIYDAMNKGIKFATGEIVGILNSDDVFFNNDVIEKVVESFSTHSIDCLFGDIVYVNRNDIFKIVRYWKSSIMPKHGFYRAWHPAHPSFYVRREIYDKYGNFKDYYQFSADFELMLRFLQRYHLKSFYISRPLVRMRLGGKTSKNFNNIFLGNMECRNAFKENNLKFSFFYFIFRVLMKVKQFKVLKFLK